MEAPNVSTLQYPENLSQFLIGAVFYAAPTRNDKNWVREVLNLAPRNLGFDEIILWATNLPVPLAPSVLLRQTNNHLRLILFTQTHHPEICFFILIFNTSCYYCSLCQVLVILLQWFELALGFVVFFVIILWHCSDLTWCYLFLFNFGIVFDLVLRIVVVVFIFYYFCNILYLLLVFFVVFLFFGTVLTWQFG